MRLVADANVVISALISRRGAPAAIIDRIFSGDLALVTSAAWERDVSAAIAKKAVQAALAHGDEDARVVVAALVAISDRGTDPSAPPAVTGDPKDDYLVALALSTGCDAIVSGDRHLLAYAGPPAVMAPRALLDSLGTSLQ